MKNCAIEKSIVLFFLLLSFLSAQDMTLQNIVERAVKVRGLSEKYEYDKAVSEALITQNSVWENPELEAELVNGGVDRAGFTVSQTIPQKEKQTTQKQVVKVELSLSELKYLLQKQEVQAEAYRKVATLLAFHQKIALMDSMITLSKETKESIALRVSKGAAMDLDLMRIESQIHGLKRDENILIRELLAARKSLSLLLNFSDAELGEVKATLDKTLSLPDETLLKTLVDSSLVLREFTLRKKLFTAQREEALASAKSDITLSMGYERNNEEKKNEFILGFGMALPIRKQNSAALAEIEFSEKSNVIDASTKKQEMLTSLQEAVTTMATLYEEIKDIENEQLPRLKEINERLKEYYKRGRLSVLELLDNEQKQADLQVTLIDLYGEVAQISADIYELTGYNLNLIK